MQFEIQNLTVLFLRSLIWNRVYVIEEQHTISNPKRKTLRFDQCLLSALLYHNKKKECSPYAYGLILPTHAYSPQFVCVCVTCRKGARTCARTASHMQVIYGVTNTSYTYSTNIYIRKHHSPIYSFGGRGVHILSTNWRPSDPFDDVKIFIVLETYDMGDTARGYKSGAIPSRYSILLYLIWIMNLH